MGLHEFMASIDSAKWLYPKDEKKITQREKEEIITTVCKQYNNKKKYGYVFATKIIMWL